MDKSREEFEAWYEKLGKSKLFTTVSIKDKMLESWKASRESLVVALPGDVIPEYEGDAASSQAEAAYCKGYNQAITEAEELIKSAGIKVGQK